MKATINEGTKSTENVRPFKWKVEQRYNERTKKWDTLTLSAQEKQKVLDAVKRAQTVMETFRAKSKAAIDARKHVHDVILAAHNGGHDDTRMRAELDTDKRRLWPMEAVIKDIKHILGYLDIGEPKGSASAGGKPKGSASTKTNRPCWWRSGFSVLREHTLRT